MTSINTLSYALITLTCLLVLAGCNDYHSSMLEWTESIEIGADLKTIKAGQPDYLTIDWENPDTMNGGIIRYYITEIKGNRDLLKMTYFMEFDSIGYRGLFAHK